MWRAQMTKFVLRRGDRLVERSGASSDADRAACYLDAFLWNHIRIGELTQIVYQYWKPHLDVQLVQYADGFNGGGLSAFWSEVDGEGAAIEYAARPMDAVSGPRRNEATQQPSQTLDEKSVPPPEPPTVITLLPRISANPVTEGAMLSCSLITDMSRKRNCYDFILTGKCGRGNACTWRHNDKAYYKKQAQLEKRTDNETRAYTSIAS